MMPARALSEWAKEEVRDALLEWEKKFLPSLRYADDEAAIKKQVSRCLKTLGFPR